jgi:hypothetical protein
MSSGSFFWAREISLRPQIESRQRRLQERLLDAIPTPHANVKKCLSDIRRLLITACDEGVLMNTKLDVIRGLLKHSDEPRQMNRPGTVAIVGGEKNFHRDLEKAHFRRNDDAWFDFVITVREGEEGVELVAYNFEIRFPDSCGPPPFIRFDLNPPGHPNEEHGVRSHVHPGTDNYSMPSPVFDPIEILDLFLSGLAPRNPEKRRR